MAAVRKRADRKALLRILTAALLLAALMAMLFPARVSASPHEENADWMEKPGYLNSNTFSHIDDIVKGDDIQKAADEVKVAFPEGSDTITIGGHNVSGLSSVIRSANDMCKGIAFLFVILSFFTGLLSMRSKEEMDEEFLRRLIMVIVGAVLIVNAQRMSYGIANIGSSLASNIAAENLNNPNNDAAALRLKEKIYDDTHIEPYDHAEGGVDFVGPIDKMQTAMENMGTSIGYNFELFIPWLALKASGLIVFVMVWGRAVEIILLATFSPLAFMEIPDPKSIGHGPGMRFLKNMLALSISGAIIVFVLLIVRQVNLTILTEIASVTTFTEIAKKLWELVIIGFAQAGIVMKAGQIARSAVGG